MSKFYIKYLCMFIGLGSFMTYLPVYLEKTLNFSPSQIGIIVSIPSIIGIALVPIWGIISDIIKKQKLILWINVLVAFLLGYLYSKTTSFIPIFIVAIFFEMFRNSLLPLADTITTSYCKEQNKNYGKVRVLGSIGYALSAFICGHIMNLTGNDLAFFYMFMFSMLLCLFITPYLNTPKEMESKEKLNLKVDIKKLFTNKQYVLILLASISIVALSDGVSAYQGIHLLNLGAGKELVGMLTVFMVAPELYFMVKTKDLLKKYGNTKMITVSAIALFIRWIIYTFTNNIALFILASASHGVAIAIMTITVFDFIGNVVEKKLYTTAMTIYTFCIGIGSSVIKLIYGNIIDLYGMKAIFICSIIISIISFGIIFAINKLEYKNINNTNIISE
ncbi:MULTISPECIES: MFS transporter [Romboutsia]|uniref:Transporter, major facilitator protein n=1 Tax=Romboutsia hominis TaxID=1507512 RepID=A0A2P2BSH0_9FIRM|nr:MULTISPECIES: MFS transporter [Romboutsia]MCH1960570.1 MFS transporter [Romboutsia hominis]MCH1968997.1 MFS transporter [Romboutsia hominis]MDB8790262.1 MFS transporter [Romboutsia sp. 1001216sp1]MDB8793509.1 MFS transporter [Romboutsia sp. 1001216sp1]MDB8797051.1 MFS transporter [Romboutsia sp. 1001216sp1]